MTPPPAGLMTGVATKTKEKVASAGNAIHGGVNPQFRALFWFSVLIHLLVVIAWLTKVDYSLTFYGSLVLFFLLTIWAGLTFHKENGFIHTGQIVFFVLISAFYVLIPFILGLVPQIGMFGNTTLLDWIYFILILFPVWPLYIGFKAGMPIASKWVNVWVLGLLVLFILGIATMVTPGQLIATTGVPQAVQVGGAFDYLISEGGKIVKRFWENLNPGTFKERIINATGLNYYTGMIDDNEEAPVGLYLDNVRLADRYAYEGYPALVWADIRGKSFTEEIRVEPKCYIDEEESGEVDPSMIIIFGEEHDTLSCTFTDLEEGSYSAKVSASFNFETWAYVTYTFIDVDTKRALEIQGKNVNYELDIEPLPRAVFTNGPVMLGMASMVDQPVGIDIQDNTREPVLGVTLDNLWSDGDIERVDEFIVQIPDDFELVKCDRWYPDEKRAPFKTEEGYNFYRFSREEIGDPRLTFQSVTCRLHVKDPSQLLAGAQKVQRTFVAQAEYLYKLEKSVRINVKE